MSQHFEFKEPKWLLFFFFISRVWPLFWPVQLQISWLESSSSMLHGGKWCGNLLTRSATRNNVAASPGAWHKPTCSSNICRWGSVCGDQSRGASWGSPSLISWWDQSRDHGKPVQTTERWWSTADKRAKWQTEWGGRDQGLSNRAITRCYSMWSVHEEWFSGVWRW